MSSNVATVTASGKPSLVKRFAARFGVDEDKLLSTLKATAFKVKDGAVSNEQMMALLVVADQYGLNPFTKEIFAFPDKQNGIVPVVGVDGWSRLINAHEQFNGAEFRYSDEIVIDPAGHHKPCPEWCEAILYRKDREHAMVVREYFDEVYRPPFEGIGRDNKPYIKSGPWQSHTKRMLRHKVLIQCSRIGFGYVGIYDEDEAMRIVERDITPVSEVVEQPRMRDQLKKKTDITEADPVDAAEPDVERPNNPVTYAEIAGMLNKAQSQEVLDQAADLIASLTDEAQKVELALLYDKLGEKIR